jgi:hypothetical protein
VEFIGQLWLPILLSAVFVFIMSAIVHMVLPHHKNEWGPAPGQDGLQNVLRGVAAGQYAFPMASDPKERMTPESMKKWAEGPSGFLVLFPPGGMNMGKMLFQSFVLNVVISLFAAYVAWHALPMGPDVPTYLEVHRVVGTMGFMTYGLAAAYESIWYGRSWKGYAFNLVDALLYGVLMGGTFGWLWPR